MTMEGGIIIPDRQGMTDRQAALIAAATFYSGKGFSNELVLGLAEKYLKWLRKE